MRFVLFNEDNVSAWQTAEDIEVMVSNRNGKDAQIFCAARDVQIGDNVWEHNIVQTMRFIDEKLPGIRYHYGRRI